MRGFKEGLRKLTSLLLAAVLFTCLFENSFFSALAANSDTAADTSVQDTDVSKNYSVARPQENPTGEQDTLQAYTEENTADTESEAETENNIADDYAVVEEHAEEYALDAQDYEITAVSSYELAAASTPVYTLTQAEIDKYNDPKTTTYTINSVDDWLMIEALSKEVGNFEGKTVYVQSAVDADGKDVPDYGHHLVGTGFTGLGSSDMPFAGELMTNVQNVWVECDCPLIDYMSSKATIERFVLNMNGGNAGIAGTLVFEGDAEQTMLLKGITVTGYLDDTTAEGVGGLFGTVINMTDYRFTIDAAKVSGSETDGWGGIKMTFSEHDGKAAIYGTNVGTLVGKAVGNVTVIVNDDFNITVPSLYGTESTGRFIGWMEYAPAAAAASGSIIGGTLAENADPSTYPVLRFDDLSSFSGIKNIQGTGYNGGAIGYTDHAKIYSGTAMAKLTINDCFIAGGKATGGFIGYAQYTTIDNAAGTEVGEIRVSGSTFECMVATGTNDNKSYGYVGGFIGIYGDGNSLFNGIAITVDGNTFKTANVSDNYTYRYLGGFVGKYASTEDIVITPESAPITIVNNDFKVCAPNTSCGGFVSYVPSTAGTLNIDTSLYISDMRVYQPNGLTYYMTCGGSVGGIASSVESNNLTVKNITITAFTPTVGNYVGAVAGQILGENSVLENITIDAMEMKSAITNDDGSYVSINGYENYRIQYGAGVLVGRVKRSSIINNITITRLYFSPYLYNYNSTSPTGTYYGAGGLIGVLGDNADTYTITDISNIYMQSVVNEADGSTEDVVFNSRHSSSSGTNYNRYYTAGLIGAVYSKTAVKLDGALDLSGVTKFTANGYTNHIALLVGYQREALIYMEPSCQCTYGSGFYDSDGTFLYDELGRCGGIYRNETFWDDPVVTADSVSASAGTYIIEQTGETPSDTVSGIRINASVQPYDGGWGLSTMGDFMRFTIVNYTMGYYGLECFAGAGDYSDISGGTFTVMNDIDLSARYMGVLTLNKNDNFYYSSSTHITDYKYMLWMFHGTFKGDIGVGGEYPEITLPSFPVQRQMATGGLFAAVTSASFKNLKITGSLSTSKRATYTSLGTGGYSACGALSAYAYNNVTVENIDINDLNITICHNGREDYVGTLFGDFEFYHNTTASAGAQENIDYFIESVNQYGNPTYSYDRYINIKNVTLQNTNISALSTDNSERIGGLISRVHYYDSTNIRFIFNLDNVDINTMNITSANTGTSYIGGLIQYAYGYETTRGASEINMNDVKIDGMNITSAARSGVGSFYGREWHYTDANITFTNNTDRVCIANSSISTSTTYTDTKLGGVLYQFEYACFNASDGFVIENTTLSIPNSTAEQNSFLISQAQYSVILLRDYYLRNTKVIFNGTHFDEIAGVVKTGDDLSLQDDMGIVSISDSTNPFCLKEDDTHVFHVYEYQSDYSECPKLEKPYYNPYTRYYYNLDEVSKTVSADPIKLTQITYKGVSRNDVLDIKTPEQFLIWHVIMTMYANNSNGGYRMKRYFGDCFDKDTFSNFDNITTEKLQGYSLRINGVLDMSNLSIYPTAVTAESNATANKQRFIIGADFDNENAGKGNNGFIFNYDEINTETNNLLAEGRNCIVLRSSCTTANYLESSQHTQLHCGLFCYAASVNEIDDIYLSGSVGAIKRSSTEYFSGAVFCSLIGSISANIYFNDITLDGLYVVNPNETYDYTNGDNTGSLDNWSSYYGLLVGGWENTAVYCTFDTIVMTGYDKFLGKYPNKKVAAALIGHIGTSDTSGLKRFEFANMSIADAEEDSVLGANNVTLSDIHKQKADQVMAYASYVYLYEYLQAEKGFYNFYDTDYFYGSGQFTPASGKTYYITLGKELGTDSGETKTEYYNTSILVGLESYDSSKEDTDFINFTESAANYWLNFSNLNYKPYIYAERNINVNYKTGDLNEGCGTYEDPYLIWNANQLYTLYCYLSAGGLYYTYANGDISDSTARGGSNYESRYPQYHNSHAQELNSGEGWKVNIPGNDDEFCNGVHEQLIYNSEENPVTGFDDKVNPYGSSYAYLDYGYDKGSTDEIIKESRITVNYLRNAYYKITADIDMTDYPDFYGLCHHDVDYNTGYGYNFYYPFTGVIIGEKTDGSAPTITMPNFHDFTGTLSNMTTYANSYGFVSAAKGCVLKNLNIKYPEDSYMKLYCNTSNNNNYSFGGAIGVICGGDNILDNVRVEGSVMINQISTNTSIIWGHYGGLVGSIYGGGLILRNFSTDDFADFDFRFAATSGSTTLQSTAPPISYTQNRYEKNIMYEQTNGIVGKVMDGYVICESADEPRKATDIDGDPQTKIDLDNGSPVLDFTEYDANDTRKLHAQHCYSIINAKYFQYMEKEKPAFSSGASEGSAAPDGGGTGSGGRIKIKRSGYDFDTELENEDQIFLYAQTMNCGGFFTAAGSPSDSANDYYTKNINYTTKMFSTRNNLCHVYHCSGSYFAATYDGCGSYDVYSRSRKADYNLVGKCSEDSEDYQYAKKYDNINMGNYLETDYTKFDENSYKNYIGYNYLISKYFDFYTVDGSGAETEDEFWIMRRGGYRGGFNSNTQHLMHNLYNVYSDYDSIGYQGTTNLYLSENGTYDMSVYKNAFRGIGNSFGNSYVGGNTANNLFNGSFDGRNATVNLAMNSAYGARGAGLFTRLSPGMKVGDQYSVYNSTSRLTEYYENVPVYEIKNLNLTGYANVIYNSYYTYSASNSTGTCTGLLAGYIRAGRYKISNVHVSDASVGGYYSVGGLVGQIAEGSSNTVQLMMENCTAENVRLTNYPEGATSATAAYMGGIFGAVYAYSSSANTPYIIDCSVSNISAENYSGSSSFGGVAGLAYISYSDVYNISAENIHLNHKADKVYCGGIIGQLQGSYQQTKNISVKDVSVEDTHTNTSSAPYIGGVIGFNNYPTNVYMENISVDGIYTSCGFTTKSYTASYFTGSYGAYVGGVVGYSVYGDIQLNGVYVENIDCAPSEFAESQVTMNSDGTYRYVRTDLTQRTVYAGGIVGYFSTSSSYESRLRISSPEEERVTATPTPRPTAYPRYDADEPTFERPAEPENPNKGKKSYVKNNNLIAQHTGGIAGCLDVSYPYNTYQKWLIEDIDITENKIVSVIPNAYTTANHDTYSRSAGGMFGYTKSFMQQLYSSGVNIEHNVIGTVQNAAKRSYCGGVYGWIAQGSQKNINTVNPSYYYDVTVKNNYIGPLDLIENGYDHAPTTINQAYWIMKSIGEAYNKLLPMSVEELGAYTRLYVNNSDDTDAAINDEWNYSLTEKGTGEWYAQDNLYKYTLNVGTLIGYNPQTNEYVRRFHTFFVAPNIIYDDTQYTYINSAGETVTAASVARRPAVDEGSASVLTASGDPYAYRTYTHTVYNDANNPTKYGEWDTANLADHVVADGLEYADNNDYLFAQLRNIYDDYKNQISDGYIDTADYDETTHTYRLKDNYGQDENGYTMEQVYDYTYYGYDRDTDGTILNPEAGPHYLSPYEDKDGKTIPMLVYKPQYGTPDVLINSIINILTNNGGAYNTNVGYYNNGSNAFKTTTILGVESWKMNLTNGEATPVYNDDGSHKQGGFSVTSTDSLPEPSPSTTATPCPQVRHYSLSHTSYDTMEDAQNGTFTVLHITYGWSPADITMNGSTIDCTEVMTLDIPIYVSKLLEVQINMKTLDGVQLAQSNIQSHGTESGTVVLKTTNTIMAEYVYDYPRTMYNEVRLKKKLTFETAQGSMYLYKNTKITLIDVTDNDKEYYYYIDNTVANPVIPFEHFVDENGINYKTRDVSNLDDYPILGTASEPFTDLRGQTWGGTKEELGDKFINANGVGIERFIIIIDKSATAIDASDTTGFTIHSVHVRVDDENTDTALMERIRYDGRDYQNTSLNTPTEDYPNPDWYGGEVNGYTAYNYVTIREIDDAAVDITGGNVGTFDGIPEEKLGIGAGCGLKATVDYSITASANYWNESGKAATDQYLDFVISVQRDNRAIALPIGTRYSFDGVTWYTIGIGGDYSYGKRQIYYYADRYAKAAENGEDTTAYQLIINKLGQDTNGSLDIYFDFTDCRENSFSDGNYIVNVDAYKTTKREFPVSGDYQDNWQSDVYSVYNSSNIGFALQENDLLYRGINRYLPKLSDNGVIDFKAQLDFRSYIDEDTGAIKDVVANQYYTLGVKLFKKNAAGEYEEYYDYDNRFIFYYDKAPLIDSGIFGQYDGKVDDDDPVMYGYDENRGVFVGGVTYKFTDEQLNGGSSIKGVTELALRLKYKTKTSDLISEDDLMSEDFSNYKFIVYLYLSDDSPTGEALLDGASTTLTETEIQSVENMIAEPLSDFLIFTVARLKTN